MSFIDSHNHFWQFSAADYGWIDETMPVLRRDYLPADLIGAREGSGVSGSVAVEARQSQEETRFLLELARREPSILGVVGWVDLADPGVQGPLEGFCADPRFKGVRHVVQAEPDPAFLDRQAFNQGISRLAPLGLTFDLLVFPEQLEAAIRFVDRHPNQTFVLDHIAKPDIANGPLDPLWLKPFRELARRQNVMCKVSGMVTEVVEPEWTADMLAPYVECALEAFGPERLMFGSDWPVCLLRSSYLRWWRFVADWAGKLSANERDMILGGNARRFYSL